MKDLELVQLRPRAAGSKAYVANIVAAGYHGDVLYLVGGTGNEPTLLATSDLVHFHAVPTPQVSGLRDIHELDDESFVLCGEYGGLWITRDRGKTWDQVSTNTTACLYSISSNEIDELFVCGDNGTVFVSRDFGTTWKLDDLGTKETIFRIAHCAGFTHLLTAKGELIDGHTRQTVFTGPAPLTSLMHTPFGIFVTGDRGQLWRSRDGAKTFERLHVVSEEVDLEAVEMTQSELIVVGSRGTILRSPNGTAFTLFESGTRNHLRSISPDYGFPAAFIGGEGGCFYHLRAPDDTRWVGRLDKLEAEGGFDG